MKFFSKPGISKFSSLGALDRANKRLAFANAQRSNPSMTPVINPRAAARPQAATNSSIRSLGKQIQNTQSFNPTVPIPTKSDLSGPRTPSNHNVNPISQIPRKALTRMINDSSIFSKKVMSRAEQLNIAEELIKRRANKSKVAGPQVDDHLNPSQANVPASRSALNYVPPRSQELPPLPSRELSNNGIPIPPTKTSPAAQYSPEELQALVDQANGPAGELRDKAVAILKELIKTNQTPPKVVSPVAKRSDQTVVAESIKADQQAEKAAEESLTAALVDTITKELIVNVWDEKGFEYRKYIECIHMISSAHKASPALVPILNKALGKINRMQMYKLPEDLMNKFIMTTLAILIPDKFGKQTQ